MSNYDQQEMTAAAGGMEARPETMPMPAQTPDDTPNLSDPSQFPNEPLTTGLMSGR